MTGDAELRTRIAGHQFSLELRVLTMAAQAADTAVFELDRGGYVERCPSIYRGF